MNFQLQDRFLFSSKIEQLCSEPAILFTRCKETLFEFKTISGKGKTWIFQLIKKLHKFNLFFKSRKDDKCNITIKGHMLSLQNLYSQTKIIELITPFSYRLQLAIIIESIIMIFVYLIAMIPSLRGHFSLIYYLTNVLSLNQIHYIMVHTIVN